MKKNIIQRLAMPQKELEAYYRAQRAERHKNNEPIRGIGWRKRIHRLVNGLIRLSCELSGLKLTVIGDHRSKTNRPVIYACTHIGRYDVEMAQLIANAPNYIFMGDPGELYKRPDGIILFLRGTLYADTAYRDDCHIGKENAIRLLKQGGNLLIYPEGAWNITENQVVMPLFPGTAEIAIRTGAEIVPIAIEQYSRQYYANIGENISPAGYDLPQKQSLTDLLRDTLCTLKWEIWEQFPVTSRTSLPVDAAEQYLTGIMSQSENGYTVDEIIRTRFHQKETTPEEAFAHLEKLVPSRKNAFLFRMGK